MMKEQNRIIFCALFLWAAFFLCGTILSPPAATFPLQNETHSARSKALGIIFAEEKRKENVTNR